jgi:methionyl-tRNA formyltransferase
VNPPADGLRPAAAAVGGSRVRTAFLGSGAFAVPILRSLSEHPSVDLVGVVTAPPRPAGRRQALAATPVQRAADELGLGPVLIPERLRSPEGVLADYGRLVPAELLEPRHGALNLHPSLLPRHRGATPIPATILAGDPITGVTLMRMDAGLDTGPIVAQTRWALEGDETTPELEAALADEAAALLERSLDPWLAGELPARMRAWTPTVRRPSSSARSAPTTRGRGATSSSRVAGSRSGGRPSFRLGRGRSRGP